jgi:hypothetical protein
MTITPEKLRELMIRVGYTKSQAYELEDIELAHLIERHVLDSLEGEPIVLPCCGYTKDAIKWNQFNGVVQCHNCGQTYCPSPKVEGEPVAKVSESYVCPDVDGMYRATVLSKERLSVQAELYLHPSLSPKVDGGPASWLRIMEKKIAESNQLLEVWKTAHSGVMQELQEANATIEELRKDALIKAAKVEALRDAANYFSTWTHGLVTEELERMAKEIEEKK